MSGGLNWYRTRPCAVRKLEKLCWKVQVVPLGTPLTSGLWERSRYCCVGKWLLVVVKIIWNTKMQPVGRMYNSKCGTCTVPTGTWSNYSALNRYKLHFFSHSILMGSVCFFQETGGTRRPRWLRHCATSHKVTISIPNIVTGNFHWHILSGRTMALGLTQPLTDMSTRNISWG
jgi:hypothetical protein